MRNVAATLGLVIALGCGGQTPPQEQIDVVGIRSELLAIAQAERQYLLAHSTYGTIGELTHDDLLNTDPDRRGYTFSVSVDGNSAFTATAIPSDANKAAWPTLVIDQTMQITQR